MLLGAVKSLRRPAVPVDFIDGDGRDWTVEAQVDTGFTGELTLPMSAIDRLGLESSGFSTYRVGGGSLTSFDSYHAAIRWGNSIRQVTVLASETFPLIGVGLLWYNNLSIDFRRGGDVSIAELDEG